MKSFVNEGVRVLLHAKSIVEEDDLDRRWEEVTGEVVNEVIFFSKHTAVSNKPALTVHPIGKFFTFSLLLFVCVEKCVSCNDLGWCGCGCVCRSSSFT